MPHSAKSSPTPSAWRSRSDLGGAGRGAGAKGGARPPASLLEAGGLAVSCRRRIDVAASRVGLSSEVGWRHRRLVAPDGRIKIPPPSRSFDKLRTSTPLPRPSAGPGQRGEEWRQARPWRRNGKGRRFQMKQAAFRVSVRGAAVSHDPSGSWAARHAFRGEAAPRQGNPLRPRSGKRNHSTSDHLLSIC